MGGRERTGAGRCVPVSPQHREVPELQTSMVYTVTSVQTVKLWGVGMRAVMQT